MLLADTVTDTQTTENLVTDSVGYISISKQTSKTIFDAQILNIFRLFLKI